MSRPRRRRSARVRQRPAPPCLCVFALILGSRRLILPNRTGGQPRIGQITCAFDCRPVARGATIAAAFSWRPVMGKRIVFVGAGAVGGYSGAHMAKAGEDVTFIDSWPENVDAINRDGFHIN